MKQRPNSTALTPPLAGLSSDTVRREIPIDRATPTLLLIVASNTMCLQRARDQILHDYVLVHPPVAFVPDRGDLGDTGGPTPPRRIRSLIPACLAHDRGRPTADSALLLSLMRPQEHSPDGSSVLPEAIL